MCQLSHRNSLWLTSALLLSIFSFGNPVTRGKVTRARTPVTLGLGATNLKQAHRGQIGIAGGGNKPGRLRLVNGGEMGGLSRRQVRSYRNRLRRPRPAEWWEMTQ